eukprot:18655-Heterococcus_DN1.PRE.2
MLSRVSFAAAASRACQASAAAALAALTKKVTSGESLFSLQLLAYVLEVLASTLTTQGLHRDTPASHSAAKPSGAAAALVPVVLAVVALQPTVASGAAPLGALQLYSSRKFCASTSARGANASGPRLLWAPLPLHNCAATNTLSSR